MRTQEEINELGFLAQEAISLGATKYPILPMSSGIAITEEWLEESDAMPPLGIYQQKYGVEHKIQSAYERGIMTALQDAGYCIPTYTVSTEGQNELD